MSDNPRPVILALVDARALEARLDGIEDKLAAIYQEVRNMADASSAEQDALAQATADLTAELADVSTVDDEIANELVNLHEALGKINPVDPAQVNAVAAVTEGLKSITAKLKAAGEAANPTGSPAAPPAPAPATGEAAAATEPAPAGDGTSTEPAPAGDGTAAADPAAAIPADAQSNVLLVHASQEPIDESVYLPTNEETAPTDGSAAQPVYRFHGDVSSLDAAQWTPYTGATKAVA